MLTAYPQMWTTSLSFSPAFTDAVRNKQQWWAARRSQGLGNCGNCPADCKCKSGLGGLTFDGTGLFGTGLFSGDIFSWGVPEIVAGLIGGYAIYSMFFQARQTKVRLEASAQRRRKSRAARYRAKAKRLEEREFGGIFA